MGKERFYRALSNPYFFSDEEMNLVEDLTERYPYFQVAQILKLQNSYGEKDKYERLLHRLGIHIPDAKYYYKGLMLNKMYVAEQLEEVEITEEIVSKKEIEITENVIEEEVQEKVEKTQNLQYAPSFYQIEEKVVEDTAKESYNFTDWLSALEEPQTKAQKTATTISNFIKADKKPKEITREVKSSKENKEGAGQTPEQLMSQTLAEIYVKQQLYDRAIAIYKKLDLNSSEKNTTFAVRIEEINELKNN